MLPKPYKVFVNLYLKVFARYSLIHVFQCGILKKTLKLSINLRYANPWFHNQKIKKLFNKQVHK